jgi:hypothetical protein
VLEFYETKLKASEKEQYDKVLGEKGDTGS